MARGKKTGGRNFVKGDKRAGRPKGRRNKVPASFKASIRLLYERLANEQPELFEVALVKGLKARAPASFAYLQMGAHYLDGKPVETVKVQPDLSNLTDDEVKLWHALASKAYGTHAAARADD